ncbi:MAG TPA: UbiA family prenyltransferase [Urbifossiella sp.]|nr:UbiA family prenyltransferase [Urbifossiella sp.]
MPYRQLLAYAQLLRLPNVFTAFADIAMTACVGIAVLPEVSREYLQTMALLALASGCLYLAGMVWNDIFDREEDRRDRPFRPLPSGRVTLRTAAFLGTGLTFAGVALAFLANAAVLGICLACAVLLYDAWLKRTPLGPIAMAACRFLNVLLGLSAIPDAALSEPLRLHLSAVVGIYIVGVTWFARTEAAASNRWHLRGAALVMAAALVLALVLRNRLAVSAAPAAFLFPYLLVAFGFWIGVAIARAIRQPGSKEVQTAVKRCVLGLAALDAVLATAFVGVPGLLLLLLLPPALALGKWVYST